MKLRLRCRRVPARVIAGSAGASSCVKTLSPFALLHAGPLDAGNRALLPLWVLLTGDLTRAEIADAVGPSDTQAGVRLQRMRDQLELCRSFRSSSSFVLRPPRS